MTTWPSRALVVWCPDWPVLAAGVPSDEPTAVVHGNRAVAASPAARVGGGVAGRAAAAGEGAPVVVASEGGPAFLAPFPIALLDDPDLADLLPRLGLRTLGALAALPATDMVARFGPAGRRAHRRASGL